MNAPTDSAIARIESSSAYKSWTAGLLEDPYDLYHELRSNDPVHWSSAASSWVLTRHSDVASVLQYDARITAERLSRLLAQLPPEVSRRVAPLRNHLRSFVQFDDPPEHTRHRATAARFFTPRFVEQLRPRIQAIVDELLDDLEGQDQFDLIADLAFPLPAIVIAEVLGIPPGERDRFKAWADRIADFFEGVDDGYAALSLTANEAVLEMEAFLRVIVEERRRAPQPDLITGLLGEADAGRLSEGELFGWCMFLLLAGHETTTGLIGNAIVSLIQRPEQLAELRADPGLVPSAIEELLRFDSPVQRISRVAVQEITLDGKTVRPGDRLWAMIGAANRDPDQFDKPDDLDLRRNPNRHLAFGYGIHFCLGAPLARLEGQLVIKALIQRFSRMDLAAAPERRRGVSLHQYRSVALAVNHLPMGATERRRQQR
jgi:cytochrome P450